MDTIDAIKTLNAAGKGTEVMELLQKEAGSAARTYEQIRSDGMYSDEARQWQLAVAYVQRRHRIDRELADKASRVVTVDRDDAGNVFGIKGLEGDQASLVISRRDAADRVAVVTDRGELRELLRRATRSGDEVLARAVAERALENQDPATMNAFLADRPHLEAAGERLWRAQQASRDTFAFSMHLGAVRPHELSGMSADSIEALASTQPAGANR